MGFWSFRAGRGLLCAASAVALTAASGCLRTSVLVQKFNDGVIETGVGDPKHPPVALRKEKVERRVE
jgi:hypothetical protein